MDSNVFKDVMKTQHKPVETFVNVTYVTHDESYQESPGPFHVIGDLHRYGFFSKLYIFSSFYQRADANTGRTASVQGVGLLPMLLRKVNLTQVFCHLTYEGATRTEMVSGQMWKIGTYFHRTSRVR